MSEERNRASTKPRRAYFRFESETATSVCLAGSFNDWDPEARPLRKGRDGLWRTYIALPPGIYAYRYVVDGVWTNDPDAPKQANGLGGENCIKVMPAES